LQSVKHDVATPEEMRRLRRDRIGFSANGGIPVGMRTICGAIAKMIR